MSHKLIIHTVINSLHRELANAQNVADLRRRRTEIIKAMEALIASAHDDQLAQEPAEKIDAYPAYERLALANPKRFRLYTILPEDGKGKKLTKARLKKRLRLAIDGAIYEKQLEIETFEDLKKDILRTKNSHDLKKLDKGGKTRYGYKVPTLEQRFYFSVVRKQNSDDKLEELRQLYKQQKQKLDRDKWIKIIAILFTVVSSLILGVVAATAILIHFPVILAWPAAGLISLLTFFTLAGSLTEGLVWYGYLKKFFAHIFGKGIFEGIDSYTLKEELQEDQKRAIRGEDWLYQNAVDRFDLTPEQEKAILAKTRWRRRVKKLLSLLVIPIAAIAGVGFAAITFANIIELLGIFQLAATGTILIVPWTLSVILGVVCAMIFYKMLQTAVKQNIFYQIKVKLIELFSYQSNNWDKLSILDKFVFHFKNFCKGLLVLIALAVSVLATYFMASECFNGIIAFCETSLNMIPNLATHIGIAVGAVMLANEFSFTLENSLNTTQKILNMTGQKLSHVFKHPVQSIVNLVAFIIHVAGIGAISLEGAAGHHLGWQIAAGVSGTTSEVLQDLHAIIETDDEGCQHGHNHDVWGSILSVFRGKAEHKHHTEEDSKKLIKTKDSSVSILKALGNLPKAAPSETETAHSLQTTTATTVLPGHTPTGKALESQSETVSTAPQVLLT